jgi:very-short-patch-repair endonuclease
MGKKKNLRYDSIFTEEDKANIVKDYVENLLTISECMVKYGIRSKTYIAKLLEGKTRNTSEANKLAHKKYPEAYLHSEETKAKIRKKRLAFMKAHPEQTAWRQKNMSYLEEMFLKFLTERGYADKFLIQREFSVFPYFIDFAFVDLKIAIEIDGSQHLLPERKKKDELKDALLHSQGWRVIRIAESVVKTDWDIIQQVLDEHIHLDTEETFSQVGIVKAPKKYTPHGKYIRVKRDEFGRSEKMNESAIKQRKCQRPDKETLYKEIVESGFRGVGKKYGVSDKAICKWCLFYGMSNKSKDYKKETLE